MKNEEYAHDFALEIIKMWYDANKDNLEIDSDGSKLIPTPMLATIYDAAYNLIVNG